jgi:DNA repair protein RecN (Recombination protein N)
LVEVHGQSANIALTKSSKQRELLDQFGGEAISKSFETYQESFRAYHELKDRISEIKKSLSQSEKEIAELEEFVEAFKKLSPKDNEIEELDQMIARLSSVEELRLASEQALETLNDEESGALTTLGIARKALENARNKDLLLESMYQNLSESFFLVSDASSSLSSYVSSLEADPQTLENMQQRKSGIVALIKRWGGAGDSSTEIQALTLRYKNSSTRIADLRGGDARVIELEKEFTKAKSKLKSDATTLSEAREKSAGQLSKAVTKEIVELSMPHTTLTVAVSHPDYATSMKESDFTSSGCDEVAIYLQGDRSAPLVLLSKGASGGEMSRVMLALEVVLAKTHPVGTYVFDEIDAGVGGKAAIEVGRRLFELSKFAQVIVVTHLPQVAAWADSHFVVTKNNDGVVTQSDVKRVDSTQRVEEIARMLAGLEESSSAKEHATELLAMRVR